MDKFVLESYLTAPTSGQNAPAFQSHCSPWQAQKFGRGAREKVKGKKLGLAVALALVLGGSLATGGPGSAAAPPARTLKGAGVGPVQAPAHNKAKRPGYRLTVTVRNPHCPACLRTLKTYLLALNGVRTVSIDNLNTKGHQVKITALLAGAAQCPLVIERIKAHDLEVLGTKGRLPK